MKKQLLEGIHYKIVNECWEWIRAKDNHGYGLISVDNKTTKAHRLSYSNFYGNLNEGNFVCHTCDNRCCINPLHLFLGNAEINNRDARDKGKYIGRKNADQKGSNNNFSKLTEKQVELIRNSRKDIKYLSNIYLVSEGTIRSILSYRTWKHIPT